MLATGRCFPAGHLVVGELHRTQDVRSLCHCRQTPINTKLNHISICTIKLFQNHSNEAVVIEIEISQICTK